MKSILTFLIESALLTDLTPSVYTSPPSKFIVDGRVLYVHGQLVSRHSTPLSAKINARTDYTIIDGVNKDTFVRFIEWAYKGYYTAAEYKIDAESPSLSKFEDSDTCTPETEASPPDEEPPVIEVTEIPPPEPRYRNPYASGWGSFGVHAPAEPETKAPEPEKAAAPAFEDFDYWEPSSKSKAKKGKKKLAIVEDAAWDSAPPPPPPQPPKSSKQSLQESFHAREYSNREDLLALPTPRRNQSPNENYTPTFLSHAHLYIFACKYGIPPLKTLALENLHTTLKEFTLHPERTGDVIELLRYIYGSSSREFKDGGAVGCGDMREMLKGYIGFQMDVLMKDREFRGLMKEEGELLDDFVEMVGKRI